MMFNSIKKVVPLFICIMIILPWNIYLGSENRGELLIIYDEYKEYAEDSNNLNYVIKMALTTGKNIELRNADSYTTEDLNKAQGIIILSNKEDGFKKSQIDDLYTRSEKLLWIGKNSSNADVIPLNFKENKDIFKVKKKINDKFNNKDKIGKNSYLVIDDVYPYDDLNLLVKKADYLYENGIPFIVSAMGVYENLGFDSMKRYTEALRYCVSRGGTIILGEPYLYDKGTKEDELIQRISIAQDAFAIYKVYPIGLTINDDDLYRNDRLTYLSNVSTIIINENENLGIIDFEKYSISGFNNVLIKIEGEKVNFSERLLTDVAIGIKGKETFDSFKEKIDLYKKIGLEFSNPRNLEGKLTFGNNKIINNIKGLMVNGVNVSGNKFISNEELYGKEDETLEKEQEKVEGIIDLTNANKWIFIITITGVIVFIIFLVYSFKIDRKKYFK